MLKSTKSAIVLSVLVSLIVIISGCVDQQMHDDLKTQNRIQQERITGLESDVAASEMSIAQMKKQLDAATGKSSANYGAKSAEINALESDIEKKRKLIARMQEQLLKSGVQLPVELSVKLQEFADKNKMVTYDSANGMLKFKSDLLFASGSDTVEASAIKPLQALCRIMNSPEAKNFDLVVAGHTDDVAIRKAATKAKHPTNWHLSVHRAISVANVIITTSVTAERISVKGFGEYRPLEPNKKNKKGNPVNRRVEIFVVPSGR
jgi:chemotaxis protein MotB